MDLTQSTRVALAEKIVTEHRCTDGKTYTDKEQAICHEAVLADGAGIDKFAEEYTARLKRTPKFTGTVARACKAYEEWKLSGALTADEEEEEEEEGGDAE